MSAPETDSSTETDTDTDTWDVIVIGAGPPGENVAQYAIQGSDRTAVLVEAELVGGECSFWACMPSKGLLRPVELLREARNMPGLQNAVTGDIDVAAVLAHRDEIVHDHDDTSQVDWAKGVPIDVVRGRGRLAGARTVEVTAPDGTTRTLHARQAVVLGTGTTANVAPVDGLAAASPWISRDVTNLHEVPTRVAVIGGGVVACESATWLNGLGADVTIIQRSDSLLAGNEPFAGELVAEHFRANGVDLRLGAHLTAVRRADARDTGYGHIHGGPVELDVDGETITVDEVVVATGRTPASTGIGLESIGLSSGGFVEVDDHLAVAGVDTSGGTWLYAIGDVNGRALLTHMGKYQARIAGAVIAARAEGRAVDGPAFVASADHGAIPQVTFTDPEVGSIGRTEQQARADGFDVETVDFDMAGLAGSYVQDPNYEGHAKIVIDRARDVLLGATFVGPGIAEMVHAATIAVVGEVPLAKLWHAVPSYPTVSEVWLRLLETRGK